MQNIAPSWIYLQDCRGMHGQQNVKFSSVSIILRSVRVTNFGVEKQ